MADKALRFNQGQTEFYQALRKRVEGHFQSNKISKHANGAMIAKTAFFLIAEASLYALVMFGGFSTGITLMLWAFLGLSFAFTSLNIGHDAIHGSYSGKKWVNDLFSHTFNLHGASAYMWTKMHNAAHHTYTNVDGYDEDIEAVPVLRMSPAKKLMKIHRFQFIYSFLFYGLATISWALAKDYVKFFKNDVGNFNGSKHPAKEYFYLFFYKILTYAIWFVAPFYFIDMPWQYIVIGILIMHYVAGFTIAIIFMLAHVVEETHFPMPDQTGSLENSFAVHQLYTTADFARKSWLAGFLTGGLNFQVEHHLFPHICHIHYPAISKIVEDTAKEYGVPYFANKTFIGAIGSHVRFLKKMGRMEKYVPKATPLAA